MSDDKKIILFGAGLYGKKALQHFGNDKIWCFADNYKSGTIYCGKKVISFDELKEIKDDYKIIIACNHTDIIKSQLLSAGINNFEYFCSIFTAEDFNINPELEKFKDIYKGKRCFIIGTGPSLRTGDLDVLHQHQEISFASNKIYKIFDSTDWRPDVLAATDPVIIRDHIEQLINSDVNVKLITDWESTINASTASEYFRKEGVHFFQTSAFAGIEADNGIYSFSDCPPRVTYTGGTVTYAMLQWAAYMGIKTMYLLGVDNSYKDSSGNDSQGTDHFCKDYMAVGEKGRPPKYDVIIDAYRAAELYSRDHGFRIYNATRGGKLEVFERVDFDSLF